MWPMTMTPGGGPAPSARPPATSGQDPANLNPPLGRVLHWSLMVGGIAIIVDLTTQLVSNRLSGSPDQLGVLDGVNLLLNLVIYSVGGAAVFRETGQVRLAALMGLLAGLFNGLVIGAATVMARPAGLSPEFTADMIWQVSLLQNMLIGTLLASVSAWFSRLGQRVSR